MKALEKELKAAQAAVAGVKQTLGGERASAPMVAALATLEDEVKGIKAKLDAATPPDRRAARLCQLAQAKAMEVAKAKEDLDELLAEQKEMKTQVDAQTSEVAELETQLGQLRAELETAAKVRPTQEVAAAMREGIKADWLAKGLPDADSALDVVMAQAARLAALTAPKLAAQPVGRLPPPPLGPLGQVAPPQGLGPGASLDVIMQEALAEPDGDAMEAIRVAMVDLTKAREEAVDEVDDEAPAAKRAKAAEAASWATVVGRTAKAARPKARTYAPY